MCEEKHTPGSKVLKDRRSPRRRGRTGTGVRQNAPELDVDRRLHASAAAPRTARDVDQPREVPVRVRPRDEVREAVRLEQLVLQTFAHASQHADDGRVYTSDDIGVELKGVSWR